MALMNTHPVLQRTGITFCRPPDTFYPELRTLFTARIVEPRMRVGPDPSQEVWMEPYWDNDTPSPATLYDIALQYGPVHHVTVRINDDCTTPPWEACVPFFDAADADKFEMYPEDKPMMGWLM